MMNFIKKVYSRYNSFIKNAIDRKYWKIVTEEDSSNIELLHKAIDWDILKRYNPDWRSIEETGGQGYDAMRHAHSRYLYRIRNCIIEPRYNWVITGRNKLFRYSYPYFDNLWFEVFRPSMVKGLTYKVKQEIPVAAFIQYSWSNYYHFYVDILTQIEALGILGVPKDVPIIVPSSFATISYVKSYMQIVGPFDREIIVMHKSDHIFVKELYIAKEPLFSPVTFLGANKLLENIGDDDRLKYEKIFVVRGAKYKRELRDIMGTYDMISARGYTIIDPGKYSLQEQVKIFRHAKQIVSVHGAALSNMLFCTADNVKILELFADDFQVSCFWQMSVLKGIRYSKLVGSALGADGNFEINIKTLETKLAEFEL